MDCQDIFLYLFVLTHFFEVMNNCDLILIKNKNFYTIYARMAQA